MYLVNCPHLALLLMNKSLFKSQTRTNRSFKVKTQRLNQGNHLKQNLQKRKQNLKLKLKTRRLLSNQTSKKPKSKVFNKKKKILVTANHSYSAAFWRLNNDYKWYCYCSFHLYLILEPNKNYYA